MVKNIVLKGNIDKHHGEGIVAFIDILGFSDDIIKNWDKTQQNPLKKILRIKDKLPIIDTSKSDFTLKESKNSMTYQNEIRHYESRISSISDSITISFGFDEVPLNGDLMLGFMSVIGNILEIWKSSIQSGYTIRGAVDYGSIYWDKNEIIGPSFITAYSLESKVAKTSRVVISSDLNYLLKEIFKKVPNHEITKLVLGHILKDIDGYLILNPQKMIDTELEKKKLVSKLNKIKKSVKDKIIREKYSPLIETLQDKTKNGVSYKQLGTY